MFFFWCHVRHINPIKIHPEKITQKDKELANDLDYDEIEFPLLKEDFNKIEIKNNICINAFFHENKLNFQSTFLIRDLKIQLIFCL